MTALRHRRRPVTMVVVRGAGDAFALRRALRGIPPRTRTLVDLSEAGPLTTDALKVLLAAERRARRAGGAVELLSPGSDVVLRLYELVEF